MGKIAGKWCFVTGSSRGIGQRIAVSLAQMGCNVVVHGRKESSLEQTVIELSKLDIQYHTVAGELDSPESVSALIQDVQALPCDIDILYNNAAINNVPTPVFDFTPEQWVHTFQVNLFAVVQLCSAFAPGMRDRGWGRVVNVTSGIADQPNLAPYSVSKAAIDKYTKDLAAEFKDENILVNHVDPGWIRTDLGGPDAWEDVSSVIPGMLVPVLLDDSGPSGRFYAAQDFKGLWD